jgi:hypothetical protein
LFCNPLATALVALMAIGAIIIEETKTLEEIYPKVKPFLRKELQLLRQGTWTTGTDGDLETPLIDNKDCAYVIFDGKPLFAE